MQVEYWSIAAATSQPLIATKVELAAHIATEWSPCRPTAFSDGLTALLDEVLEQQPYTNYWLTKETVAGFERQWRGVTSFIFGVAFCQKIVRQLGYRWSAPVTFYDHNENGWSPFSWWSPYFDVQICKVERPVPPLSPLMPDYIVARPTNSAFEISFVESKGTVDCLASKTAAPDPWQRQSKNAVFQCNGVPILPAQNIVVATRLQPKAVHDKTRQVQVRAWNSSAPAPTVQPAALREIILLHYMGIFSRMELRANAQRLALAIRNAASHKGDDRMESIYKIDPHAIAAEADREIIRQTAPQLGSPYLVLSEYSTYRVGRHRLAIGLLEPAFELIIDLCRKELTHSYEAVSRFLLRMKDFETTVKLNNEKEFLRNDGVFAQFL